MVFNGSNVDMEILPVDPTMMDFHLRQRLVSTSSNMNLRNPGSNSDDVVSDAEGMITVIYRAKCDPIEIPRIAHNVTWYDPFYEKNGDMDTIIAAFDIDHKCFGWYAHSLAAFIVIATSLMEFTYFQMFPVYIVVGYGIVSCVAIEGDRRSKNYEIRRKHVAITRHGIYIDIVDDPIQQNLQIRKIIKFHDIQRAYTQQTYGFKRSENDCCPHEVIQYRIILKSKRCCSNIILDGIVQQQKFIDIVNEMIDRSNNEQTAVEMQ